AGRAGAVNAKLVSPEVRRAARHQRSSAGHRVSDSVVIGQAQTCWCTAATGSRTIAHSVSAIAIATCPARVATRRGQTQPWRALGVRGVPHSSFKWRLRRRAYSLRSRAILMYIPQMSYSTPCACTTLRKAARAVTRFYDAAIERAGMTTTQFAVLRAAERAGTVTMSRVADDLVMDRTSLYRTV